MEYYASAVSGESVPYLHNDKGQHSFQVQYQELDELTVHKFKTVMGATKKVDDT